MDLGLDAPGAIARLKKTVDVIGHAQQLAAQLPDDPALLGQPGTELYRWIYGELPDPTVDPRLSILSAVSSALECLAQIRRFILDPRPTTTPVVIAALMRTALLSGVRPIFMLGPRRAEDRKRNILRVMRQETDSLFRCYSRNSDYVDLAALVPPKEVLAAQSQRRDRIRSLTATLNEVTILEETAAILAETIASESSGVDIDGIEDPERFLGEQLLWMFNAYSGKAHGYGWPRMVAHPGDLPADFVTDLTLLANLAHRSVQVTEEAHLGRPIRPSI